jgi:DNA-binding PadR family transcriptional regulator
MEKRGWIRGRWVEKDGARRRRFYRLTPKGAEALSVKRATWKEFTLAVNLVVEPNRA